MVIENSVRCPEHRFAVAFGIPRDPEAGLNVISDGLNALLQSKKVVSGLRQWRDWLELRRDFDVVTTP